MKIKYLKDKQLLKNTKVLVNKEKKLSVEILNQLAEIERRKLYSDLKYSSLFAYCMGELDFSDQEAFRRIDAMRLARQMPEVKKSLEEGILSITNTNMISSLFRNNDIKEDQKIKIVQDVAGSTKKECEKKIDNVKRNLGIEKPRKKEVKHKEDGGGVRLHLSLSKETYSKIEKLKGLLAHEEEYTTEKLIDLMADHLIEKTENKKFRAVKKITPKKKSKGGRYIPKNIKDAVYKNAGGKCQNCGSIYALELDHINAYGKGGSHDLDNLQLLCRNCNSRRSIQEYGLKKIESFTFSGKSATLPIQSELLNSSN